VLFDQSSYSIISRKAILPVRTIPVLEPPTSPHIRLYLLTIDCLLPPSVYHILLEHLSKLLPLDLFEQFPISDINWLVA